MPTRPYKTIARTKAPAATLLRPSALWTPDFITPASAWLSHGPFAFWLMDVLRPRRLVELGTHTGYSYFCFCQAIQTLGLNTESFAVDTWQGDEHSHAYGEDVFEGVAQRNAAYASFSHLKRMTFDQAVDDFADGSIDLLHIDGLHFYDAVKHDFESWRPKLSRSAIVLFHDTRVRERQFGVWKYFRALKRTHATFEFRHGHGLGVVAVNHIPPALRPLFNGDPQRHEELAATFAFLGGAVAARAALLPATDTPPQREEAAASETRVAIDAAPSPQPALTPPPQAVAAPQVPALVIPKAPSRGKRLLTRLRLALPRWRDEVQIIRRSAGFDADWYLATYRDVALAGIDPALHYFQYGAREGRDPGPLFSTAGYGAQLAERDLRGLNPLVHFEAYGRAHHIGRRSHVVEVTARDRAAIARHIAALPARPLISVVMPVYNTPERLLREAVASVTAQLYPHWELCIADDASPDPAVARVLADVAAADPRIKVTRRAQNGHISAASNSGLALATGSFVALLDHDDLLHETALYEVAVVIAGNPTVDIIYSDEDVIDDEGRHSRPYFKTDFNPELLFGQNMVSHLGCYRRSLLEQIGGFRLGFEGSQDYDLTLRAWQASSIDRIHHIPAVLYHWRHVRQGGSFSQSQLDKCTDAARLAIADVLRTEGQGAQIEPAPLVPSYSRVVRRLPEPLPLVSIIVPTKDRADLLAVCADGILHKTDYANLELLIVDHESREEETLNLLRRLRQDQRVRVLPYHGAFNYSAMNNMAAAEARGSVLALVNNDIEVTSAGWLAEMVSHAVRPEIGAVGSKLLYPNGQVQHAGVVIGMGGVAGHAFCGLRRNDPGYFCQAVLTRAVSAVTGACLVVRKKVYEKAGGLNAAHLAVAFNDVDLCLKIQALGFRNVWTPFAELVHHESVSRGPDTSPEKRARIGREIAYMTATWPELIAADPFYNLNLSLVGSRYEMASPSRRTKPWAKYLV
jgi:glycosyltransferase involved in cell wall biosynthesis